MRQFSAEAFQAYPRHLLPIFLLSLLGVSGCRKEEISTYSAPKEAARPAPAASTPAAPIQAASPVHWTVPSGWEQQPPSGMRVGSFRINKEGQHADVSVIPLVGGNELDNVNRWRGQVGLPPIDAFKLPEAGEKVMIGSTAAALYDLAGSDAQSKEPTRILAAILPTESTSWFFKMIGTDALVEAQKSAFKEFLQSVHMGEGMPAGEPSSAGMPALPDLARIPGHENLSQDKPEWTVPNGWQSAPPTSMRLATFAVTGQGGAKADVSVIKLGGTGGGLLANVNRWRGQVGLKPVDEAELQKLISTQSVNGSKMSLLDMAGRSTESSDQVRLLVAIVPGSESTWFYKMVGNDQLVAQQKDAFVNFVQSARYPHAL